MNEIQVINPLDTKFLFDKFEIKIGNYHLKYDLSNHIRQKLGGNLISFIDPINNYLISLNYKYNVWLILNTSYLDTSCLDISNINYILDTFEKVSICDSLLDFKLSINPKEGKIIYSYRANEYEYCEHLIDVLANRNIKNFEIFTSLKKST